MRNYNLYYTASGFLVFIGMVGFINWSQRGFYGASWLVGLVEVSIAIMQLITAVILGSEKRHYPVWVNHSINNYWFAVAGYFLVLFAITRHFTIEDSILRFWLYGAPWGIALLQFRLVYRLGDYKKEELLKTEKNNHSH